MSRRDACPISSRSSPRASRRGSRSTSASRSRSTSTSIRDFVTENAQEARDLSLQLLSGVKTGGADPAVDARQPRADPGRDVLPAARLEHDRSSASTTLVPRRWRPKVRADRARHRQRARRIPARAAPGDARARHLLRDRRCRSRGLDHALAIGILTGAARVHSVRRLRPRPHARRASPRCCNGTAGRASSPCSRSTASASCWRTTCWCRSSSATASACIRSR